MHLLMAKQSLKFSLLNSLVLILNLIGITILTGYRTISSKIGLLGRLRQLVLPACLTKYYVATAQSHIDYCLTILAFASDKNLNRLQKFQNRAARIITKNFKWDMRGVNIVKGG